jgi:nucleotide-binding universal stress UspA family protein
MMRRILIALDGSPSSVQAAWVGCGVAKARKAGVDGVAIVNPIAGHAAAAEARERAGMGSLKRIGERPYLLT